jgi:hypothetical protein
MCSSPKKNPPELFIKDASASPPLGINYTFSTKSTLFVLDKRKVLATRGESAKGGIMKCS